MERNKILYILEKKWEESLYFGIYPAERYFIFSILESFPSGQIWGYSPYFTVFPVERYEDFKVVFPVNMEVFSTFQSLPSGKMWEYPSCYTVYSQ